MVPGEWSLPALIWAHESFIVFSLPYPGEEWCNRAVLVATWCPARVNPSCCCNTAQTWPTVQNAKILESEICSIIIFSENLLEMLLCWLLLVSLCAPQLSVTVHWSGLKELYQSWSVVHKQCVWIVFKVGSFEGCCYCEYK